MISIEGERFIGFQGTEHAEVVCGANGEYMYPASVGVMVANTDPQVEPKLWVCGDGVHPVRALCFNPARTVVVVAEQRLKVALILYSNPQRRQIQRVADVARVGVASMAYCRDGTLFALLADSPQCNVTLFTVDAATQKLNQLLQTQKPHTHLFQQISFSPRDSSTLCGSGGGHLVFWHHDAGTRSLTPTEGRVTTTHVRLTSHTWLPTGQVACGTQSGEIFLFPPEDGIGRCAFELPRSGADADPVAITSLQTTRHHVVTGCSDGTVVFVDHAMTAVQFVVHTTLPAVRRIQFAPEWHTLLVCSDSAIGLVHLPGYEDARRPAEELKRQQFKVATLVTGCCGAAVGVCHHKGTVATIVSKEGTATTFDYQKNALLNVINVGDQPLLVRRFGDSAMAVTSSTGMIRFVDYTRPASSAVLLRAKLTDAPLGICEVNKAGSRLLVSDGRTVAFFNKSGDEPALEGVVRVNTASPASILKWVEGFGGFLLCQASGDVGLYSCPFFDEHAPVSADGLREIPSEQLFVNSWRLDFPVVTVHVTGVHDEAINVLCHSLDKETKLYLLDRSLSVDRKDRESKAIKPQLTMKDHEKRGTGWTSLRGKYSISIGADGRLALRDTAAYANRMAVSSQPTKEKRDPICSVVRHASLLGGILGIGVSDDETRFVTAGGDGFLGVWAVNKQQALPAAALKLPPSLAVNNEADDSMFYAEKRRHEEEELDRLRHADQRASTSRAIERLRERLQQIRKENEAAAEEEKVPLQDFLVDQQRENFEEQCALAVQEMADAEHFANLNRDYVTGIIKKDCWDVMDVKLTRLNAMNAPAHVMNFHERKTPASELLLLRKLKFLRLVEMKDAELRNVKELADIKETADEPEAEKKTDEIADKEPLAVGQKTLEQEALDDPKDFLYSNLRVFTKHRAVIQLTLLKGRTLAIRSTFNKAFNDLVNRKKTDIIKIEERNVRCRQVLKELDEDRPIFAPGFSKEEDPKHIFDVADAEVPADKSADPDEKRRVAAEAEERRKWIERHGNDDSSEKALKAWMDGRLDKEIRTLDVKIDKPEFADESSEKFVPLEDRSEDQQRIYREYEKAVAKRIEEVAQRRAALQSEFAQLQKESIDQAKKFDAQVAELFQRRLVFQQQCHEVELTQVKLAQCVLLQQERTRLAKKLEQHRQAVSEQHARAVRTTQAARVKAQQIHNKLDQLKEDEKAKEKNLRSSHPFSDPEWGETLVRIYTKKRPKKPDAKGKKDEKKHEEHSEVLSPDPFAFVEHERLIKSKRYQDDPQFQVPKLDQGDIPPHVWDAFQKYRHERVNAEREIACLTDDASDAQKEVEMLEMTEAELAEEEREAFEQFETFQKDALREQFDVDELYTFRQGQVEVEQAPVVTDYADAILIHSSQIHRLNKLVRDSGAEKVGLMRDINEKKKEIRLIEWEMEFLSYGMRSFEMELRHLHTLRVTKQMQEYINGGGDDHNEKERSKLTRHIEHVRTTMAQKIEERRQQILKLKRAIKDKELENMLLLDQVAECKGLVDERKAIRDLQSSELDAERINKLMKDMFTTRQLEDVAKAQQEEMLLLKKEIDRLRERTFPSFAVVSKRVVGNPDQI